MPSSKDLQASAFQVGNFAKFKVAKPKEQKSIRKRSKFNPERREEVKVVRSMRACLRCALLKLKCSHHDICLTCKQLAFVDLAYGKKVLGFSGCIRTKLQEVSVFQIYLQPGADQDVILPKRHHLNRISVDFPTIVVWDLENLTTDIVDWFNDSMSSGTSKVGILSIPQFLNVISSATDEETRSNFQLMLCAVILASKLFAEQKNYYLSISGMFQIGIRAGDAFLKQLDERLKPLSLNSYTKEELKALFLLIFGTILAVGHILPQDGETPLPQRNAIQSMQNHLCQILAHYLVYLSSRLNLALPAGADQFLIQATASRWNQKGLFFWGTNDQKRLEHIPEVIHREFTYLQAACFYLLIPDKIRLGQHRSQS